MSRSYPASLSLSKYSYFVFVSLGRLVWHSKIPFGRKWGCKPDLSEIFIAAPVFRIRSCMRNITPGISRAFFASPFPFVAPKDAWDSESKGSSYPGRGLPLNGGVGLSTRLGWETTLCTFRTSLNNADLFPRFLKRERPWLAIMTRSGLCLADRTSHRGPQFDTV